MDEHKITEQTYREIQRFAIPFEEDLDTALLRILSEYARMKVSDKPTTEAVDAVYRVKSNLVEPSINDSHNNAFKLFDPNNPPSLTHTKVRKALIDGSDVSPYWNQIMNQAHVVAVNRGIPKDKLIRISAANLKGGKTESSGFDYIQDIDISIQGVDANYAWKYTLHLMQHLKIPVEVEFQWRNKPSAAFPGEIGRLLWRPTTQ